MKVDKPRPHKIEVFLNESHPKVAKNFSLFADNLNYYLNFGGQYFEAQFSNHLTELNAIIAMLDFRKRSDTNKNTLIKYTIAHSKFIVATQPLFNPDDYYIKKFCPELPDELSRIIQTSERSLTEIKRLYNDFNNVKNRLEKDYFENVVKLIYTSIDCTKHGLKYHCKYFDYLAKLAFAYYYSFGFSRTEINWFISKLFKSKVHVAIDGHRILVEGVLPLEIKEELIYHNRTQKRIKRKSFNQELFNKIERYYKFRSLHEQVFGLLHIIDSPKIEFDFLFRVDNLALEQDYFSFYGTTIYNGDYFLKTFKSLLPEYNESFFELGGNSACYVKICFLGHSQYTAEMEAVSDLNEILNRLGQVTDQYFQLNRLKYAFIFKGGVKKEYVVNPISKNAYLRLEDVKILESLDGQNFGFNHDYLDALDEVLADAFMEKNVHQSLSKYWKLCDILVSKIAINKDSIANAGYGTYSLQNDPFKLALISSFIEFKDFRFETSTWAYSMIINNEGIVIKEGVNDYKYTELLKSGKSLPIKSLYKDVDNVHVKYRLRKALESKKNKYKQKVEFYAHFFLKLWTYRNAETHFNHRDDELARYLSLSVHEILLRIRREIGIESRKSKNKNKSVKQILEDMIKESLNKLSLTSASS